jgi:hypothetical protein
VPADDYTVQALNHNTISLYGVVFKFISSLYVAQHLQDFVNLTGKFNSIVIKTLKPVLWSSHDCGYLNLKKYPSSIIVDQYGSFKLILDLC